MVSWLRIVDELVRKTKSLDAPDAGSSLHQSLRSPLGILQAFRAQETSVYGHYLLFADVDERCGAVDGEPCFSVLQYRALNPRNRPPISNFGDF